MVKNSPFHTCDFCSVTNIHSYFSGKCLATTILSTLTARASATACLRQVGDTPHDVSHTISTHLPYFLHPATRVLTCIKNWFTLQNKRIGARGYTTYKSTSLDSDLHSVRLRNETQFFAVFFRFRGRTGKLLVPID